MKVNSETPAEWRSDAYSIWSEEDKFSLADSFKGERKLNGDNDFRFLHLIVRGM